MSAVSCLGGWCAQRDTCRYHSDTSGQPIERLCEPGQADAYERISFAKPATSIHTHKTNEETTA